QTFVIPTANVQRVERFKREAIKMIENRETISLGNRVVSLAWLDDVLELPRREKAEETKAMLAVVLGAGDKRVAFVVDEVLDEHEVLVKNLGKLLERVRNVAAATVLGSGKVVPILNVADLLKSAAKVSGASARPAGGGPAKAEAQKRSLLVIDDSVTSRM